MKDEDWKEFIKKEMDKSIDDIMAEIEADPKMKDVKPPEGMYEELMEKIHEHERQTIYEQLSDEDKELIQLGKVYKRKRRFDRLVVALAAVIVGLWLGTVCIGDEGDILGLMNRIFDKGEEVIIDSDSVEPIVYVEESDAYEKIEKDYGFTPVKLNYLPVGTAFKEAIFCEEIQTIYMYYGVENKADITYIIRPNYRESSFVTVIEDDKLQEYTLNVDDIEVWLTEYNIAESNEKRWSILWTYQDVQYLLNITNMEQVEVEKIVNTLRFIQ